MDEGSTWLQILHILNTLHLNVLFVLSISDVVTGWVKTGSQRWSRARVSSSTDSSHLCYVPLSSTSQSHWVLLFLHLVLKACESASSTTVWFGPCESCFEPSLLLFPRRAQSHHHEEGQRDHLFLDVSPAHLGSSCFGGLLEPPPSTNPLSPPATTAGHPRRLVAMPTETLAPALPDSKAAGSATPFGASVPLRILNKGPDYFRRQVHHPPHCSCACVCVCI